MRPFPYHVADALFYNNAHLFPLAFDHPDTEVKRGAFSAVWLAPADPYVIKATVCPVNVAYLTSLSILDVQLDTDTTDTCLELRNQDSVTAHLPVYWLRMPKGQVVFESAHRKRASALAKILSSLALAAARKPTAAPPLLQWLLNPTQEGTLSDLMPNWPLHAWATRTAESVATEELLTLPIEFCHALKSLRDLKHRLLALQLSEAQKTVLIQCYTTAAQISPHSGCRLDSVHSGNLLCLPLSAFTSEIQALAGPTEVGLFVPHDLLFNPHLLQAMQSCDCIDVAQLDELVNA